MPEKITMADGALSWLAMVAGAYFADGNVPRRGELPRRPYGRPGDDVRTYRWF